MTNKFKAQLPRILICLTMLIALAFRTYKIAVLPGGLFPDEAANGLDINSMEQGVLEPFYERGNGREALFFYLLWGSVKVFGRSPFAHHLVSALIGTLAVLACYLLAKQLFHFTAWYKKTLSEKGIDAAILQSKYFALIPAFIMAVSSWHLVLSRTAFRANMIALLAPLTIWAMLKIVNMKARSDDNKDIKEETNHKLTFKTQYTPYFYSILFGVFFALGFYTYIAFRIMAPLLVMLILWPACVYLYRHGIKKLVSNFYKHALVAIAAFIIVFAPLGHHFYTHPGSFVGRSGQVSIFNPELNGGDLVGTFVSVSKDSLLAYFFTGDANWRHNISEFPFISPYVSTFFALGLILVLARALVYFFRPNSKEHYFSEFLMIGLFSAMLLPVVTTAEGIPHGLRAIGTIPVVFIITGFGMWQILELVRKFTPKLTSLLIVIYLILMALLPLQTFRLYFVEAANSPEYYESFRADLTVVSNYLNQYGNRTTTYLVLDKFSVQTVDYLTTIDGKTSCDRDEHYLTPGCIDNPENKPFTQVDPERSWMPTGSMHEGKAIWPYDLKTGDEVIFTLSSFFDIKKFREYHPDSDLVLMQQNHLGQYIMAVYKIK